jgi:CubicO group peptidase (beta-lactamase class C family)
MKNTTRRDLLGLGAALLAAPVFSQDSDARWAVSGTWTGVLESGSQRFRLRIVIHQDGRVSIYSLDQGADAIPAKLIETAAPAVRFEARSIQGEFTGQIVSVDRMEGTWKQGGNLPLVLLRGEAGLAVAAGSWEPLTPDALENLRADAKSPALAAAVVQGSDRRRWVTGRRSALGPAAVQPDDLWHLGSITKSMTATLVARMVDAGMITFDDTVEQHLGEVAPRMRTGFRGVTFRHLLSHRAGLPSDLPLLKFGAFIARGSINLREQRRDWARYALDMKPLWPAGKSHHYSNNGYIIAGAMLEAAFDKTWEDLLREQVFAPLKLTSAGFGPPRGEQPLGHKVEGNSRLIASLLNSDASLIEPVADDAVGADNPPALGPAGTVHMSLDDVLTYLSAHRDRGDFLEPETWRTLHTPPYGGDYALGWMVRADGTLWHSGSNTSWYAEVAVDTANRRCAVAAANEARLRAQRAVGKALMRALNTQ